MPRIARIVFPDVPHHMTQRGIRHQDVFFTTSDRINYLQWLCLRYVEQNPVHAGMVKKAEDYPWSSAAAHCGMQNDPNLSTGTGFDGKLDGWREILREAIQRQEVDMIRKRTISGVPLGDKKFLMEMGKLAGMDFMEKEEGRPKKSSS